MRIQIEGPKVSVEKLLPGVSWNTEVVPLPFPQPAGLQLAALAYQAVYGKSHRPDTTDLIVRDEYLGWIMKPVPSR